MNALAGKRVLLIVGGGIAAYKTLELVRMIRKRGGAVTPVLTRAGAEFVTPLSLAALAETKVATELFSLTDEAEMGHIQLSRSADLVVVAPLTADLAARMVAGIADDLATTLLLATDTAVLAAPAMNVRMWDHPATVANMQTLAARGVTLVGPDIGEMACGEFGPGRMAEPSAILAAIEARLAEGATKSRALAVEGRLPSLAGRRVVVTSGPTHEPIDPVRYIANRSSGRQGHAIAAMFARCGADTVLVTGPVSLADPVGARTIHVETALDMQDAVEQALPADVAIFAAAVADWRPEALAPEKVKKLQGHSPSPLRLVENPDVLQLVSHSAKVRPQIVVGFAAETERLVENAQAKLARKGCDWILANDVGAGTGVFGGDENEVTLVTRDRIESWPRMSKDAVALRLAGLVERALAGPRAAGGGN